MTAAGDLRRVGADYELVGGLARRQEEQAASLTPVMQRWDGTWRMAIAIGRDARPAPVRVEMRGTLRRARLAEWREGVWIRPRNIETIEDPRCAWLDAWPDDDPGALAARLFAPARWSRSAMGLIARLDRATAQLEADPAVGIAPAFVAGAAALRHIRADPLLPPALLPTDWPGLELRRAYVAYERRFHTAARAWFRGAG